MDTIYRNWNISLLQIGSKTISIRNADPFYVLHSQTHQIIEINPKQLPSSSEGSVQELEKQAREMIALVAPDVDLDTLTPVHGSKIGTYFFRWEDRYKPLMDDNRNYPFLQVGLNGKGELLNYYNTLPLAK